MTQAIGRFGNFKDAESYKADMEMLTGEHYQVITEDDMYSIKLISRVNLKKRSPRKVCLEKNSVKTNPVKLEKNSVETNSVKQECKKPSKIAMIIFNVLASCVAAWYVAYIFYFSKQELDSSIQLAMFLGPIFLLLISVIAFVCTPEDRKEMLKDGKSLAKELFMPRTREPHYYHEKPIEEDELNIFFSNKK